MKVGIRKEGGRDGTGATEVYGASANLELNSLNTCFCVHCTKKVFFV